MKHRRRGVFLIEMLTVLLMLGIGGTLLATAFGSMLRSQRRVSDFGNQYAQIDGFLSQFSRDVRRATTASLHVGDENEGRLLVLEAPNRKVAYRFFERRVERSPIEPGDPMTNSWESMIASVDLVTGFVEAPQVAVGLSVQWRRTDKKDPDRSRRFDLVVRCAGALGHVED